ncbi:MAG: extracellular solute-binding protein [Actinobacteria bacterium]|nr:extracellular solute-binding protein [Actinomycetota bacterium]
MKKILVLLFVAILVVTIGAGCTKTAAGETTEEAGETTEAAEETAAVEENPSGEIVFTHYWSSGSWKDSCDAFLAAFSEKYPDIKVTRNDVESESFKTQIGVMLAGDNSPDVFSYWGGARTQFFVDKGLCMDISGAWKTFNLDSQFAPTTKEAAATYNGKEYGVPLSMFPMYVYYNKEVFDQYGLAAPTTWDEFLSVCDTLKSNDVIPIALGTKDRWPAYVWFDAILVRTAGLDFREGLMVGEESYTDPKVLNAFTIWAELLEKGYFDSSHASLGYGEDLAKVASGEAGMVYNGTFAVGTLTVDLGMVAGETLDFFKLPAIDTSVNEAIPVSYDVIAASANAKNPESVKYFMEFAASVDAQKIFKEYIQCLSPNINLSEDMYSEFEKKEIAQMEGVSNFFPYDLATDPTVADEGLTALSNFLANPANIESILADLEAAARETFGE